MKTNTMSHSRTRRNVVQVIVASSLVVLGALIAVVAVPRQAQRVSMHARMQAAASRAQAIAVIERTAQGSAERLSKVMEPRVALAPIQAEIDKNVADKAVRSVIIQNARGTIISCTEGRLHKNDRLDDEVFQRGMQAKTTIKINTGMEHMLIIPLVRDTRTVGVMRVVYDCLSLPTNPAARVASAGRSVRRGA